MKALNNYRNALAYFTKCELHGKKSFLLFVPVVSDGPGSKWLGWPGVSVLKLFVFVNNAEIK
jgi:hypothetical protein